jgi:hypothetical protein
MPVSINRCSKVKLLPSAGETVIWPLWGCEKAGFECKKVGILGSIDFWRYEKLRCSLVLGQLSDLRSFGYTFAQI